METMDAIRLRRSVRRFRRDASLPRELVDRLLEAACLAPSPKNSQPWRFLVFNGRERLKLVAAARQALHGRRGSKSTAEEIEHTLQAMEEAPVVLLVYMASVKSSPGENGAGDSCVAEIQSIGASIQNMLLAATDMGLGALWICDILDVYDAIHRYVGRHETLVAAVALGYAAEEPTARPRRPQFASVFWAE